MKKIFLLLSILLFCTNVLADKMTKDGFLSNKNGYAKDQKIKDPENKILLIYNHGQSSHDGPSSDCVWKGGMKNMASLVGQKVKNKEILVYIFCTGKLKGDDYKRLWNKKKFKAPYKGKPKLEKRLDANLKLIDDFASQGFKKKSNIYYWKIMWGVDDNDVVSKTSEYCCWWNIFYASLLWKINKKHKGKKSRYRKSS